jgi:hypothetical protein
MQGGGRLYAKISMMIGDLKRRGIMGDKGGKKDKEKGQKQNVEKQKRDAMDKRDKQPKRKP